MPDTVITEVKDAETPLSVQAAVTEWCDRINKAKEFFKKDFERIRDSIAFAYGQQWKSEGCEEDRYVANLTLRTVNQKVSVLYARNPRATFELRERMQFAVWDGEHESLFRAIQNVTQAQLFGVPPSQNDVAVLEDYLQGKRSREVVRRVGLTLQNIFEWNLMRQEPEFKLQMKQLVRRVVTCGVGYVRIGFQRPSEPVLQASGTDKSLMSRARRVAELIREIDEGEATEDGSTAEQLRQLFNTVFTDFPSDQRALPQLVFDFPQATSVIVDPACRALKGFVGAKWIAQEFLLPLKEVNAFFEVNLHATSSDFKRYENPHHEQEPLACVWEVFDLTTRTRFFICDGYHKYLLEPEPVRPRLSSFWPIFALTFNDVEVECGTKASIYPPSDVDLIRHAQKEWNRAREALRQHRRANAPKYLTGAGWLTEEDKTRLQEAVPNAVIELQGVPATSDVNQLLRPFQHAPIDPSLYETSVLREDILLSVGLQEANLGPIAAGTATEATIAEQSRLSSVSSNVDDLDDLLSSLARAGGEVLLQELTADEARRIAGPGAVWPDVTYEDYIDEVFLKVEAASSGRPNRGLELANFERVAPFLLQAGANPKFIVKEALKRMDDRLSAEEAFPLVPTPPVASPTGGALPGQPGMALGALEPALEQLRPGTKGINQWAQTNKKRKRR